MGENNGYADPQQLFNQTAIRYRDVEIPGMGRFVIRSLTELEGSIFETWMSRRGKDGKPSPERTRTSRAKLITLCVVDPQTKACCYQESDIPRLMAVDRLLTGRLFDAIMEHTGYTETDLEDAVKNSETIAAEDSPTL